MHISLQYYFFFPLGIYSQVELLDHMMFLLPIFWGSSKFTNNSIQDYLSSIFLPILIICLFFCWCIVALQCCVNFCLVNQPHVYMYPLFLGFPSQSYPSQIKFPCCTVCSHWLSVLYIVLPKGVQGIQLPAPKPINMPGRRKGKLALF